MVVSGRSGRADAELVALGIVERCPVDPEVFLGIPGQSRPEGDQALHLDLDRGPVLGVQVDVTAVLGRLLLGDLASKSANRPMWSRQAR